MTFDEGHYYIYFCCDNLWKSKFMALEKPGKLREFFLLLCGHPVVVVVVVAKFLSHFYTLVDYSVRLYHRWAV